MKIGLKQRLTRTALPPLGRRVPFAFLEDIARRFENHYGERAHTAIAYGLNEFSKTIAQLMVGSDCTRKCIEQKSSKFRALGILLVEPWCG